MNDLSRAEVRSDQPEDFAELVRDFQAKARLRVWSVIITIFGDAVAPRGGRVSASFLSKVTQQLGISSAAMRTALSRLAKEGWILREMEGRHSFYQLSPTGSATFAPAAKRIYAEGPLKLGEEVVLCLRNSLSERVTLPHEIPLSSGVCLDLSADPEAVQDHDAFLVKGKLTQVPEWMKSALGAPEIADAYRCFLSQFSRLERLQAGGALDDPLVATAARTLLIHEWRRLLLRHEDLPPGLLPDDWPGEQARRFTRSLYLSFSQKVDPWLDEEFACPTKARSRF